MAYGSSAFGSESYGGSSNITPLGVITYFLSGHLSKAKTITFTLDTKIVLRPEKTFVLDAKIVLRNTKTFTLNASLQKSFSKTFTINAYLFKGGNLKTFTIDANLVHRREITFNIDAIKKKMFLKTFGLAGRAYFINYWLSSWKCRKLGTIYGSITQTAAVIQLNVFYGSGTDNEFNIYCNGKVKSDFSDLRFTKQNGTTLLQYEIVSYVASVSAVVNVKIGYIPDATGQTDFYIYFGNSIASSLSVTTPATTTGKIGDLIETISNIPATNITGLSSITSLNLNTKYIISIVGTWINGLHGSVDALYAVVSGAYLSPILSATYNAIAVGKFAGRVPSQYLSAGDDGAGNPSITNSRRVNPDTGEIIAGTYNADNTYYFYYTGENAVINIYFVDDTNTNRYTDNSGSFTANIYSTISAETLSWAQQECRNVGANIMRTHRVGLRIING